MREAGGGEGRRGGGEQIQAVSLRKRQKHDPQEGEGDGKIRHLAMARS